MLTREGLQQQIAGAEIVSILADLQATARVGYEWPDARDMPRADARLYAQLLQAHHHSWTISSPSSLFLCFREESSNLFRVLFYPVPVH